MTTDKLAQLDASYGIVASAEADDPDWDRFVQMAPDAHHVQSSLWARLKAAEGWNVLRIVATTGHQVVGGAQILTRSAPGLGKIGYVQRGPLVANGSDPGLPDLLARELIQRSRTARIRVLYVEPPPALASSVEAFLRMGFQVSELQFSMRATTRVDLTHSPAALLDAMQPKTRRNIKKGEKSALTVRDGSERDIPSFYAVLRETSLRRGFVPESDAFFVDMWRLFHPRGFLKLHMVEADGRLVCATLLVPFGDTVIYKRSAWTGQLGDRCPNDLMLWSAILWARDQGYRYFDFDGVRLNDPSHSLSNFKLGFGGEVVTIPYTLDYCSGPFVRTLARYIPRIQAHPAVRRILKRRA